MCQKLLIARTFSWGSPDRGDLDILRELAGRLGHAEKFDFRTSREVFDEFRHATAGAPADYSGITYEKTDANDGVHWPCVSEDDPGTPRMFTERFHHADGNAKFIPVEHRAAGDIPAHEGEARTDYATASDACETARH